MKLLDLFSGCGGMTLGAKNAGFQTALAVDIDPILSSSFGKNFPNIPFLRADVSLLGAENLSEVIAHGVDGVIGGPPCQGFSGIGRGDAADPRRTLLGEFFRIVDLVSPRFFVMENVPGLMFPDNKPVLDSALARLGSEWEIVGPVILDASDFGAPTKRKRVFVFGFNKLKTAPLSLSKITSGFYPSVNVKDAIADLKGAYIAKDGLWRYKSKARSTYAFKMRSQSGKFNGHQLTKHKLSTELRFSTIPQGGVDPVGKHKRLAWSGYCPTLRAGTGSDKGSYQSVRPLHPDEDRVITPREGARLQGFPDEFIFHDTVWHSFRMIGNSVSPIIAEALLGNIHDGLSELRVAERPSNFEKNLSV
ncbi:MULTISPECIES: DNA cytosine methyltransferase [Pseudomonas]|uniref:DNA cytosine methyltransferase n=1 Tax=Pseudomonas TaxID=286 RepID=UPI0009E4E504|nr:MULTISPECIES: DNA cytosine methyltransferase [Pseudomonas]